MKKMLLSFTMLSLLPFTAQGADIPDFLDSAEIENAQFQCLGDTPTYSAEDQQHINTLWAETLTYLDSYAKALTNDTASHCLNSDLSIYETASGVKRMCIMDRQDMRNLVKSIYQITQNPDTAKRCFAAREDVDWLYSPGGALEAQSPVAQWINRETFETFFNTKVTNPDVQAYGQAFSENFTKMVTGDEIKMPPSFPQDISANALPNLWAAVGWSPMYAQDSERNKRNYLNIRGGYAYAEIFGHWGLLRIDTINGRKVGAEIGMVAQAVYTFYPYHNHAIPEIYYTMRQPACARQLKNFAIREDHPLVKTVREDREKRVVSFDSGIEGEATMWAPTSADQDNLVYFHQNTIHAFDIDGDCEAKPEERAMVTVWARSNAHDTRNDYGTTHLCESQANPNTPAIRGEIIECDLTKTKW